MVSLSARSSDLVFDILIHDLQILQVLQLYVLVLYGQ